MTTTIVGWLATCLTIMTYFPQAVTALRHKSAHGLTWGTAILAFAGAGAWSVYGLLRHDVAISITNIAVLLPAGALLSMKIRDRLQA